MVGTSAIATSARRIGRCASATPAATAAAPAAPRRGDCTVSAPTSRAAPIAPATMAQVGSGTTSITRSSRTGRRTGPRVCVAQRRARAGSLSRCHAGAAPRTAAEPRAGLGASEAPHHRDAELREAADRARGRRRRGCPAARRARRGRSSGPGARPPRPCRVRRRRRRRWRRCRSRRPPARGPGSGPACAVLGLLAVGGDRRSPGRAVDVRAEAGEHGLHVVCVMGAVATTATSGSSTPASDRQR